jgi:hypothetical protein
VREAGGASSSGSGSGGQAAAGQHSAGVPESPQPQQQPQSQPQQQQPPLRAAAASLASLLSTTVATPLGLWRTTAPCLALARASTACACVAAMGHESLALPFLPPWLLLATCGVSAVEVAASVRALRYAWQPHTPPPRVSLLLLLLAARTAVELAVVATASESLRSTFGGLLGVPGSELPLAGACVCCHRFYSLSDASVSGACVRACVACVCFRCVRVFVVIDFTVCRTPLFVSGGVRVCDLPRLTRHACVRSQRCSRRAHGWRRCLRQRVSRLPC